jgi:hypothetical protein
MERLVKTITLDKYTQFRTIDIWHPLYSEQRVLIDPRKVTQHNKIVFSKANSLPDAYYLTGKQIKKFPKRSNGTIMCHSVPLEELKILKLSENSHLEL